MSKHFAIAIFLGLAMSGTALYSIAAPYPIKPIRFIVPTSPGGVSDNLARLLSRQLSGSLGQQLVVDNRVGAAGIIGAQLAARSPPDGYTIFMGNLGVNAINPGLYHKLPYDPINDFSPVALVAEVAELLVVHPSVPSIDIKEFIAYVKGKPSQLNYSSAGVGTTTHLSMELFASMANVQLLHVPYKGGVPAIRDLVAGQVHAMFPNISVSLPYVRSGQLKALAVTTERRSSLMPDLPTISESGLPGFAVSQWFGVLAPAGTPRPIIMKLSSALGAALKEPEVRRSYEKQGAEVAFNNPQEFSSYIKSDIQKWSKVIREAGVPRQ